MATINYLDTERQRASFQSRSLTYYLYGGKDKVEAKEAIFKRIEEDPIFKNDDVYFLDRTTRYMRALEKGRRIVELFRSMKINEEDERFAWILMASNEVSPLGLHYGMFIPTIKGQATPEQQAKWLPLAQDYRIIGTYAQTELGHGTYVRGLETTATYDKKTQEFVVNTPTLTATKWWPGGLGLTATHCVLMARLLIDGIDYGVHSFMVQLRSLEDHKRLPGISGGDIGPKFGFQTNDNGFLRLNNIRIPRTNMLMKFAKVNPDGSYERPPHDKAAYGTMIFVRSRMVGDASEWLAKCVTIAIRYSCVRRQGHLSDEKEELKLLDYKTQQYRLFALLSTAVAMHFTAIEMAKLYTALVKSLSAGDFSLLAETHATTAGLKAVTSTLAADGIEEARKACGGHGYSMFCGIPSIFASYVPACTYEGDNYVLLQQTARYLINAVAKGEPKGNAAYLSSAKNLATDKCNAKDEKDFLKFDVQLNAYKHRATRMAVEIAKSLQDEMMSGKKKDDAWNSIMVELCQAAKSHVFFILLQSFQVAVELAPDQAIKEVLHRLCDFFALYYMNSNAAEFMEDGYMTQDQIKMARRQMNSLLDSIRPDAVAIVDSFNYSDQHLNSALGRYDGNVYETLYKWAQEEPLNKGGDMKAYETHIKHILKPKL